jgi:hypothetical protein
MKTISATGRRKMSRLDADEPPFDMEKSFGQERWTRRAGRPPECR